MKIFDFASLKSDFIHILNNFLTYFKFCTEFLLFDFNFAKKYTQDCDYIEKTARFTFCKFNHINCCYLKDFLERCGCKLNRF